MSYITSVERIAEARGKAEGGASVLLKQLVKLFGPLFPEIEQRVRQLSIQRLEALAVKMLDFRSLQDVQIWLEESDS